VAEAVQGEPSRRLQFRRLYGVPEAFADVAVVEGAAEHVREDEVGRGSDWRGMRKAKLARRTLRTGPTGATGAT
jgi:hypothetical protein